uniref:Uncharacterized protein n=1 Tax=Salix viminalis TaxID=40686 RepID=A0A6N2NLR4_SALVM
MSQFIDSSCFREKCRLKKLFVLECMGRTCGKPELHCLHDKAQFLSCAGKYVRWMSFRRCWNMEIRSHCPP